MKIKLPVLLITLILLICGCVNAYKKPTSNIKLGASSFQINRFTTAVEGQSVDGSTLVNVNNTTNTVIVTNIMHAYSITGLFVNIGITNNSFRVTGATGSHTNSANTSLNFSGANGNYVWNPVGKGNGFDTHTNTGIFTNSSDSTWVASFQWFGASHPAWVFYNTNTWIYSSAGSGYNACIAGGAETNNSIDSTFRSSTYLPSMDTSNFWMYVPDTSKPAVNLVQPIYNTNTLSISEDVTHDPISYLMNFPHVGPTQTKTIRWYCPPPHNPYVPTNGIVCVTSGPVVVRNIEVMVSGFSPAAYRANYWLQIFPNYGTNSTVFAQVNSNYMTFNVPIQDLANNKYAASVPNFAYSTELISVFQGNYSSTPLIKINLKTPILCTNGVFARIIDANLNVEPFTNFYSTVNWEVDPTGQLNYPYSTWQLHGVCSSFVYNEPNPNGTTDWSKTYVQMMSETNNQGVVLGFWADMTGLAGPNNSISGIYGGPDEASTWEWICDGRYPPVQMEGEDALFAPYEFILAAPYAFPDFGLITRTGSASPTFPTAVGAYRHFTSSMRISWKNSIKAVMATGTPGDAFAGDIVTLYYTSK